jgi:cyclic pyranopterin monophosphate synthase
VASGSAPRRLAAGVVLSDRASAGEYEDRSGPVLRRFLGAWGFEVLEIAVVPDDPRPLEAALDRWHAAGATLGLLSGGTGLGPRDVTPQALDRISDYAVPGIGEWMRIESAKHTGSAWLSRGGAWIRRGALLVALPGSPRALEEILPGLGSIVQHALEMMAGGGHGK